MGRPSQQEGRPLGEPPAQARGRVVIDSVMPSVDCGAFPAKRVVGDQVVVTADLLIDGHDLIDGVVRFRRGRGGPFHEVPLEPLGNDQFSASFPVDAPGVWQFTLEAWLDEWASHGWGLGRKAKAGKDVSLELLGAAGLLEAAAERATREPTAHGVLRDAAKALRSTAPQAERVAIALASPLREVVRRWADTSAATRLEAPREVMVDPVRALRSSWYEVFPRSLGEGGRHGTFKDVERHLAYVAELGCDTLYLPPIHPIGRTHRKGPNNTLTAGPDDVGSPWAIGAAEGGHKAVHPQLGTLEDFRRLVEQARARGIEVAMDIAFQASPDHPYVKAHPEWFVHRADGSIQYAENPPKQYQDVYPFDFASKDWKALWAELASVFLFWAEQGVRVFRVDNPHTKPLTFWRWCLAEVKERYPDAIFLAEAFTRPRLLQGLAKAGFSQSYTYFTWRTTKQELTEYLSGLVAAPLSEYLRPNLWPNTPDILPEHLQFGTRATFVSRLVMAATLSASYGIYGPTYELMQRQAREGAEEYLDNEKFQLRAWNLDDPTSLRYLIARVNEVRRAEPALWRNEGLTFHSIANEQLLAYSKTSADQRSAVLCVVNLDPHHTQGGWLELDLAALGVGADEPFQAHDALSGQRFLWRGRRSYVELDPREVPAHLFTLRRKRRSEKTFEYFL